MVELAVVAAILCVLVVIGFGSFAGASERAHGRAVEIELRTGLEAALVLAQEAGGRFVVDDLPITPAQLQAEEPALVFADVGARDVIGVSVAGDARTIRLDQLDDAGTRHTLVAESGLGVRFCTGGEPADCHVEVVDEAEAPSTTVTTATTVAPSAPGNSGNTPAAERRQNGR